jgi:hypothetical protein
VLVLVHGFNVGREGVSDEGKYGDCRFGDTLLFWASWFVLGCKALLHLHPKYEVELPVDTVWPACAGANPKTANAPGLQYHTNCAHHYW